MFVLEAALVTNLALRSRHHEAPATNGDGARYLARLAVALAAIGFFGVMFDRAPDEGRAQTLGPTSNGGTG